MLAFEGKYFAVHITHVCTDMQMKLAKLMHYFEFQNFCFPKI